MNIHDASHSYGKVSSKESSKDRLPLKLA